MATRVDNSIIVGPVRLSYLNVFKPKEGLNGDIEYSATILIPKNPTQQCPDPKALAKKIAEAVKAGLTAKFGKEPPKWDNPLRDGDKELDGNGQPKQEGYWFVRSKCKEEFPPVLIDGSRQMVTPQMGWKSGDWGMVKLSPYGYDQKGNQGVAFGLRAVQFLYSDESLGGSFDPVAVANEFDVVEGAARPGAPAGDEYDPFADE
jgi:hypothetical protein